MGLTYVWAKVANPARPLIQFHGEEGYSPVIFGERGDATLLGMVSLETLGLILDPLKRQLRPSPMMLASHRLEK